MAKNRKRVVCYQWFSMGDVLPFHLLLKSFVFSELFSQCIYNTFINKKYQTKNSTWAEKTSLYLSYSESNLWVGQWWLTPIILAIQEAEIRRIVKLREIIHETLSWKYPSQKRAGEEAQAVEREAHVQTTNDRYFTLPIWHSLTPGRYSGQVFFPICWSGLILRGSAKCPSSHPTARSSDRKSDRFLPHVRLEQWLRM
jgi:hypothetical protein